MSLIILLTIIVSLGQYDPCDGNNCKSTSRNTTSELCSHCNKCQVVQAISLNKVVTVELDTAFSIASFYKKNLFENKWQPSIFRPPIISLLS
jgi:hypothetical protein